MARIVLVVFLLTLVLAPAADAEEPSRGGTPFSGLFDAFHGAIDWLFSWSWPSSRQAVTSPTSALIVPSGIGAHLIPSGVQAEPAGIGVFIDPSGIGVFIDPSGVQSTTAR